MGPISQTTGKTKEELDKIKEEEREHGVFYEDDYNYMQHKKDISKPEYDFSEVDRFLLSKDTRQSEAGKGATSSGVSKKLQAAGLQIADPTGLEDEEEVGLLNLAAPRTGPLLDWDPDIVETLDDAFEGHEVVFTAKDLEGMEGEEDEDELDELFKEALAEREDDADDEYEDISDDEDEERDFDSDFGGRSSDEEDDDVPDLLDARGHRLFMEEETKSRFTEYSMSSSVVRRNAQLTILDDKFEEFYAGYDDINVGGLEADDIEGSRNVTSIDKGSSGQVGEEENPGNYVMKQVLSEFEKNKESERQQLAEQERLVTTALLQEEGNAKDADKEIMELFEEKPAKDRFDCKSILSTYSTLYNHPKLIKEQSKKKNVIDPIQISGKTGMPKDILGRGLTEGALKRLDRLNNQDDTDDSDCGLETQTLASRMSALSFRNRHETAEERRARKTGMKDLKRERSAEKKANRAAFKDEEKRQERVMASNRQNNTLKIL